MSKWYKVKSFELFLDDETANLLATVLKGHMKELKGSLFEPKENSISYAQALDWIGSQAHGEVDLSGLFKYV